MRDQEEYIACIASMLDRSILSGYCLRQTTEFGFTIMTTQKGFSNLSDAKQVESDAKKNDGSSMYK